MDQQQYPTIRRRIASYTITYATISIWGIILLAPGIIFQLLILKLGFTNAAGIAGVLVNLALLGWITFKLSRFGMTIRHFIAGYAIRSVTSHKPINIIMLYVREVACMVAGLFGFFKIILPALIKRSLDTVNDDAHVVVVSNSNLYVSNKSIGSMKNSQMNAEVAVAVQNEFLNIAQNGFIHDRIFNTYAVIVPRMSVLKGIFNLNSSDKNYEIDRNTQKVKAS